MLDTIYGVQCIAISSRGDRLAEGFGWHQALKRCKAVVQCAQLTGAHGRDTLEYG